MSMDLSDLQKQLAAKLDGEATAPTVGSDDWNLRWALLNEAQRDWAERYDWEVLRKTTSTSVVSGNASYALPATFRRMERAVVVGGTNYHEVEPIEAAYFGSNSNQYFYVTGNPEDGYALNLNPTPTSGPTTMTYSYYTYPANLSNASSVSPISNPFFLVQSAYARLLELEILMQMLENEYMSRIPSLKERRRIKTRQQMAEMIRKTSGSINKVPRQE